MANAYDAIGSKVNYYATCVLVYGLLHVLFGRLILVYTICLACAVSAFFSAQYLGLYFVAL